MVSRAQKPAVVQSSPSSPIPQQKHRGSGETKTGEPHPSLRLRGFGRRRQNNFPPGTAVRKTPRVLSLLFTIPSCSRGFLERAGKLSSSSSRALTRSFRVFLSGGAAVPSPCPCERGVLSPCCSSGLALVPHANKIIN